jgi:hypothetical protein
MSVPFRRGSTSGAEPASVEEYLSRRCDRVDRIIASKRTVRAGERNDGDRWRSSSSRISPVRDTHLYVE